MNTSFFTPKQVSIAVGTALATGLLAGPAMAANLTTGAPGLAEGIFPRTAADAPFLVREGRNNRVSIPLAADQTADVDVTIVYFDADDNQTGASLPVTDTFDADPTDGVLEVVIPSRIDTPTADQATKGVVVLESAGAADTFDGGAFGYLQKDGTIAAGGVDVAAAAAAALADPLAVIVADRTYSSPRLLSAAIDKATDPTTLLLEFNVQLVDNAPFAAGIAAGDDTDTSFLVKTADDISIPTLVQANMDTGDLFLEEDPDGTFAPDVPAQVDTQGQAATDFSDGANEDLFAIVSGVAVTIAQPPAYAAAGEVAIAFDGPIDNPDADALYTDEGQAGAQVTVNIRLDRVVDGTNFGDAGDDDVLAMAGADALTVANYAIVADGDGEDTIAQVTVAAGMGSFRIDPATGNLEWSADPGVSDWLPVEVQLNGEDDGAGNGTAATGLETVSGLPGTLTGVLAKQTVKAGIAQAPRAITRDFDFNGVLDGFTVDTRQPLDVNGTLPADNNVVTVGYTAGSTGDGAPDSFKSIAATASLVADSETFIDLVITTPDNPQADGTAPDAADINNDYDGDGDSDDDDAAVIVAANLDTGETTVLPALAGEGIPFQPHVGGQTIEDQNDPETPDDPADDTVVTGDTSLTYLNVFSELSGEQATVAPGLVTVAVDGARPIVTAVSYSETNPAETADGSENPTGDPIGTTREAYGDVTLMVSEVLDGTPKVGELLFDSVPASLVNLDANIGFKSVASIGTAPDDDTVVITNLPASIVGQTLALGLEPMVWDQANLDGGPDTADDGNPLFVPDETVAELGAAGAARLASASLVFGEASGKVEQVLVTYTADVVVPEGVTPADDYDGLFVVRALAGRDRANNQDLERNANTTADDNSDLAFYDFVVPGDNVTVQDDGTVLLTMPGSGLPADTVAVWVDYEGATAGEVEDGASNYLAADDDNETPVAAGDAHRFQGLACDPVTDLCVTVAIPEAQVPGPGDDADPNASVEWLFVGTADAGAAGGAGVDGNPVLGDLQDPEFAIFEDDDTVLADTPPRLLAAFNQLFSTEHLLTMTVLGSAQDGELPLDDGTVVRVDVVHLRAPTYEVTTHVARDSVVRQGVVDIFRGPNSEGEEPVENDQAPGQVGAEDGDGGRAGGTDNLQSVALLNQGGMTGAMVDQFLGDRAAAQGACTALEEAQQRQQRAEVLSASEAVQRIVDTMARRWSAEVECGHGGEVDIAKASRQAFVRVTTGNGGNTPDGYCCDSPPDAQFGRTATLLPTLPNEEKNGTTYYTVDIMLAGADDPACRDAWSEDPGPLCIKPANGYGGEDSGVLRGKLEFVPGRVAGDPIIDADERLEVLDTAFAAVKDGRYHAVVGVDEELDSGPAYNPTVGNAFVLVTVLKNEDPGAAGGSNLKLFEEAAMACVLTNSASPGFNSYMPFIPNTLTGPGTAKEHNIDLQKVAILTVPSSDWVFLGIPGTPDRADPARPLSMRGLFIGPKASGEKNCAPATNWNFDNGTDEQMFALGLDPERQNALQVAFQAVSPNNGRDVNLGSIVLRPGAGLAFNNGDHGDATIGDEANGKGVMNEAADTPHVFVPLTGAPVGALTLIGGWHLVTVQEDTSALELANQLGVNSIVHVDGNAGATSWFRGQDTTDTFEARGGLHKGEAVLVYKLP